MRRIIARAGAVALILVVAACAVIEPRPQPAGSRHFIALTPASLGRNLSLSQLVTGEHNGKTYSVRYEVEIIGDRLTIVGLSPIGITLFTLVQKGDTITVDTRLKEAAGLDPRYTLFDLYLAYWPPDILRSALAKNGMALDENPRNRTRNVRGPDGSKVATVTYPTGTKAGAGTVIEHFDLPYRLHITPIAVPDGA